MSSAGILVCVFRIFPGIASLRAGSALPANKNLKVQMDQLQWGFPTPTSLFLKQTQIKGKSPMGFGKGES